MTDERKIGLGKVIDSASDFYQARPAFSWGRPDGRGLPAIQYDLLFAVATKQSP
ncbi:MAG: hypothetical protein ABIM89_15400 [Mycobacteriales bacterium]